MNIPKSKIFVFRLVSDLTPEDVLKQRFLSNGNSPEIQYIASIENYLLMRAWYANLESELGVTWINLGDQY